MNEHSPSWIDRCTLGVLLFDAVLLAVLELLFLPAYIGSVQFPVTVALAVFTNPLLVAVAGRFSSNGLVTAAPLLVWFATVVVFGTMGPGGNTLLLAEDWRSYLLIGGGTLPAAAMLGITRGKQPRTR
ncbi:hypothetical protein [Actinopolyspora saharensis]|uniref:Uncharacterized protein n=1 Tax=Actinopolyspora saharensis TaxID=995062 RepID=A0A1H1H0B1_9ACTN|nr:hypothetical protein [Actinopolyspora saharensis]SDR18874.1 hypothetical protein SAMN04489718_4017 [Actinopolyspora saharensis]